MTRIATRGALPWPVAEADRVEKLWQDGYSAGEIAQRINNGRSRNSVIGLLYRLRNRGNKIDTRHGHFWTDKTESRLRALASELWTTRQIGVRLGVSSAEISRHCKKLGIPLRPSTGGGPQRGKKRANTGGLQFKLLTGTFGNGKAAKPRPAPPTPPDCQPVSFMDIGAHQCRFPIGDPAGPATLFCGASIESTVYCAWHRAIAYQPYENRRRRDSILRLAAL